MTETRIDMMVRQLKPTQNVEFFFEVAPFNELMELISENTPPRQLSPASCSLGYYAMYMSLDDAIRMQDKKATIQEVYMMLYDKLQEITKQSNGESGVGKAEIKKLLENRKKWMSEAVEQIERRLKHEHDLISSTSKSEIQPEGTGSDSQPKDEKKNEKKKEDDFIDITRMLIDRKNKETMRGLISEKVDSKMDEIERQKEQATKRAEARNQHYIAHLEELLARAKREREEAEAAAAQRAIQQAKRKKIRRQKTVLRRITRAIMADIERRKRRTTRVQRRIRQSMHQNLRRRRTVTSEEP